MKIKAVGTSGGKTIRNMLTTFLIDGKLAVDCGSVCTGLSLEEQLKIHDVFISHIHMDHIGELPLLVDNRALYGKSVTVYATETTIRYLREYVFNGVVWPDFEKIPAGEFPALVYKRVEYYYEVNVGDYLLTPLPVNHVKGSAGCYIQKGKIGFAYTSDTGKTDAVWEWLKKQPLLKGVVTECSFPSDMDALAGISHHLSSSMLGGELKKLGTDADVFIYHLKPQFSGRIREEIHGLNVHILSDGDEIVF
ncbi:MAG: 3',5'-cyclic-nucleotide phosphodiesterase [Acidobacteria bacterium]|nr:3',5'-cyclic-nucleotide phosphodiesterase [Acidobacteriota bacterium]